MTPQPPPQALRAPAIPPLPPVHARVCMVQDGARLHYAVPIALHRSGLLERMYTQWFAPPGSAARGVAKLMRRVKPAIGERMADRTTDQIPRKLVWTNPRLMLREQFRRPRSSSAVEFYAWQSAQVTSWVLRKGFGAANCLQGYIRNLDSALIVEARRRGLRTIADQIIAPAAEEIRQAELQHLRWPGWQKKSDTDDLKRYLPWEEKSWDNLDRITCASDYVRDCLLAMGRDARRIEVLPYPIDLAHYPQRTSGRNGGPVTVGFVGGVNLRKGAPMFFEVARRLRGQARFVMVGPVQLEPRAVAEFRGEVELTGAVPRSEVLGWLNRFDIFLFPSTCEGSAGAVMEAMATGLPVVTTPNSGSVVRDGIDGFVLPYENLDGLTGRVLELISSAERRQALGAAARRRAGEFSLDWYAQHLAELYQNLTASGDDPRKSEPTLTPGV